MALDVTWEAEFAQAGWIVPWTGTDKQSVVNGTITPALQTAIWKGQLVAAPDNTNTQLLWYRSDLVTTPAQDVGADDRRRGAAGQGGQAALHRDPGRAVRGRDRLVQHDGGQRRRHRPESRTATKVTLGAPAVKALSVMKQLADLTGR